MLLRKSLTFRARARVRARARLFLDKPIKLPPFLKNVRVFDICQRLQIITEAYYLKGRGLLTSIVAMLTKMAKEKT